MVVPSLHGPLDVLAGDAVAVTPLVRCQHPVRLHEEVRPRVVPPPVGDAGQPPPPTGWVVVVLLLLLMAGGRVVGDDVRGLPLPVPQVVHKAQVLVPRDGVPHHEEAEVCWQPGVVVVVLHVVLVRCPRCCCRYCCFYFPPTTPKPFREEHPLKDHPPQEACHEEGEEEEGRPPSATQQQRQVRLRPPAEHRLESPGGVSR